MINTSMASNKNRYIGLTGLMASGKGEVVKILMEAGYRYISLSDIVREEAARTCKNCDRNQMQDIGNRLRREGGPAVLAKRVMEKITASNTSKWVIDGIRNPAEVRELRKWSTFRLIGIDTPMEILVQRIRQRQRDTDQADIHELKQRIRRERGEGEPPEGQQVGPCLEMADYRILNDRTLEDLKKNIDKILAQMGGKNGR